MGRHAGTRAPEAAAREGGPVSTDDFAMFVAQWLVALVLYAVLGVAAYGVRHHRLLRPAYWLLGFKAALFNVRRDRWER